MIYMYSQDGLMLKRSPDTPPFYLESGLAIDHCLARNGYISADSDDDKRNLLIALLTNFSLCSVSECPGKNNEELISLCPSATFRGRCMSDSDRVFSLYAENADSDGLWTWISNGAPHVAPDTCFEQVMNDPTCGKEYFKWIHDGDGNCGCLSTGGGVGTTATSGVMSIYEIKTTPNFQNFHVIAEKMTPISGYGR